MKTIKYPDGQLNVQMDLTDPITVNQRINSYEDLFEVASKKDVISFVFPSGYTRLVIPCLFGQRSDRRFGNKESFGLKIITDFINSMNFNRVEIFDPHSDVGLALINNSVKRSSFEFVEKVVDELGTRDLVLVSPDAGAYKKVFKYGEDLNLPVVAANKFRTLEGEVTLNILGDVKDKICLIVDDLLDGGYTFHLLAESLKKQGAEKVYLYVSHAYFNKGVDFTPNIDHFYCTNSVKDIDHPLVTQYKIV